GKAIVSPAATASTIVVPKSASLDTVTKAMTIAAWFRTDTASDTGIRRPNAFLLEDQSATEPVPDGFSFRMWTSKGLSPGVYGKTKLAQKTWNHVAGTYDGTQMSLYINGVAEKELLSDANAAIDGKWSGDVGTPADGLQLKFASETSIFRNS
ncbi:MAG: LamG protein, partial [Candidatus Poribacteria bacterium]|nr:LamG protein [Candidatus Poribacteria bacterium]